MTVNVSPICLNQLNHHAYDSAEKTNSVVVSKVLNCWDNNLLASLKPLAIIES